MTRFLTEDEKAREIHSFMEYRSDPRHFRTAHPEAKGGEGWIDPEVLPLVDALNDLRGVLTVQSCCGHRHRIPGEPDGAEYVHNGQLWLRLSVDCARRFDVFVDRLLASDVIVHVQKLYSYQTMKEPHEVFDIQWCDGAMERAQSVILGFFRGWVAVRG